RAHADWCKASRRVRGPIERGNGAGAVDANAAGVRGTPAERVLRRGRLHAPQSLSELPDPEPRVAESRIGLVARVSLLRSFHAGHAEDGRHAARRVRDGKVRESMRRRSVMFAAGTAAAAEGGTPLNAFDNALLAGGIGNVNLVKMSSIMPPAIR